MQYCKLSQDVLALRECAEADSQLLSHQELAKYLEK